MNGMNTDPDMQLRLGLISKGILTCNVLVIVALLYPLFLLSATSSLSPLAIPEILFTVIAVWQLISGLGISKGKRSSAIGSFWYYLILVVFSIPIATYGYTNGVGSSLISLLPLIISVCGLILSLWAIVLFKKDEPVGEHVVSRKTSLKKIFHIIVIVVGYC